MKECAVGLRRQIGSLREGCWDIAQAMPDRRASATKRPSNGHEERIAIPLDPVEALRALLRSIPTLSLPTSKTQTLERLVLRVNAISRSKPGAKIHRLAL
jgi:hypothetical protein